MCLCVGVMTGEERDQGRCGAALWRLEVGQSEI